MEIGVFDTNATAAVVDAVPCVGATAGEAGTEGVEVEEEPPPQPPTSKPALISKATAGSGSADALKPAGEHARVRVTAPPFKTLLFILLVSLSTGPKAERKVHLSCLPISVGQVGVKVRDVIRLIEADGWRLQRQRGSHRFYRHPEKPGTVTVAGRRGKDMPIGTLENIIWQAKLKGRGR